MVGAIRHRVLIGKPMPPLSATFRSILLAGGLNYLVPARVAEAIKASYLREHAGVPLEVGLSAVVVERVSDVALLGFLGAVAAAVLSESSLIIILTLIAVGASGAIVVLPTFAGRLTTVLAYLRLYRFENALLALARAIRNRNVPELLVPSLMLGLMSWILLIAGAGLFCDLLRSRIWNRLK